MTGAECETGVDGFKIANVDLSLANLSLEELAKELQKRCSKLRVRVREKSIVVDRRRSLFESHNSFARPIVMHMTSSVESRPAVAMQRGRSFSGLILAVFGVGFSGGGFGILFFDAMNTASARSMMTLGALFIVFCLVGISMAMFLRSAARGEEEWIIGRIREAMINPV